jgi:hypothetical protein
MTKMLEMARPPSPRGVRYPDVVARPGSGVPDSAGFRREMRDTHPIEMNAVEFLTARRYRERVDEEIGKGSERGARWWSRRLVQLYEEAGLVRLDKYRCSSESLDRSHGTEVDSLCLKVSFSRCTYW